MPIHLFWGDNRDARQKTIEKLIEKIVDPAWKALNVSRFDGKDIEQVNRLLEEVRTPPFGNGSRVLVAETSPFCNGCSSELANKFENVIELIPKETHLILSNSLKPDGRLRTTKQIQKLVKLEIAEEKKFMLPAIWDINGQKELVEQTAKELNLEIENEAINILVEAIGTDSTRLRFELEKIYLLQLSKNNESNVINAKTVNELIEGINTNSFQIADCLLQGNLVDALVRINALLESGEPALRILASLTTQIRGWLWVSLLDTQNQQDVAFIAKTAGIANPKRIYIIRKQIQGKPSTIFVSLLNRLLDIEISLKKGNNPCHAFQDGLLTKF